MTLMTMTTKPERQTKMNQGLDQPKATIESWRHSFMTSRKSGCIMLRPYGPFLTDAITGFYAQT